jgi:hypothetical protein
MDEVKVEDVVSIFEILKGFVDPTDAFVPSKTITFCKESIFVVAGWGGCFYYGEKSFLKPDVPVALDVAFVQDFLAVLGINKNSTVVNVEIVEPIYKITVGDQRLEFGCQIEASEFLKSDQIRGLDKYEVPVDFIPVLRQLVFSISNDPFDKRFLGMWYDKDNQYIYASDGFRSTCKRLSQPLGIQNHLFIPAVFLKELLSLQTSPNKIAIDQHYCYFYFSDFVIFFQLHESPMPTFSESMAKYRDAVSKTKNVVILNLGEDDRRKKLEATRRLYIDKDGKVSDVMLTHTDKGLVIKALHRKETSERGFTDFVSAFVEECDEVLNFRMNAKYFLDACARFDSFIYVPSLCFYAYDPSTKMEQVIGWKV